MLPFRGATNLLVMASRGSGSYTPSSGTDLQAIHMDNGGETKLSAS